MVLVIVDRGMAASRQRTKHKKRKEREREKERQDDRSGILL